MKNLFLFFLALVACSCANYKDIPYFQNAAEYDGTGKERLYDLKIMPKDEVVIPVSQHIGAPAKPVIEIGDRVLKGQLIAKADGFVSANIHSSISGEVKTMAQ